jgi:hypothetical protein
MSGDLPPLVTKDKVSKTLYGAAAFSTTDKTFTLASKKTMERVVGHHIKITPKVEGKSYKNEVSPFKTHTFY